MLYINPLTRGIGQYCPSLEAFNFAVAKICYSTEIAQAKLFNFTSIPLNLKYISELLAEKRLYLGHRWTRRISALK